MDINLESKYHTAKHNFVDSRNLTDFVHSFFPSANNLINKISTVIRTDNKTSCLTTNLGP